MVLVQEEKPQQQDARWFGIEEQRDNGKVG
jgi:hypothetical protein